MSEIAANTVKNSQLKRWTQASTKKYAKQLSDKKSQNKMASSEIIHSTTPKNLLRPCVGEKGKYCKECPKYWKQAANKTTRDKNFEKKISQTGIIHSITVT